MTNKMRSVFLLDEPVRHAFIAGHRFYIAQAKARLLSTFANIEQEADDVAEAHWQSPSAFFDPDVHDEATHAEDAQNEGITFYGLLSEMHERTRLSVVAGMYHQWDKEWRRFLVRQLRWPGLVPGPRTRRSLWTLDSTEIEGLLRGPGLEVRTFPNFARLDAMRLVVNVFKHGEGQSLDDLRQAYPEFVPAVNGWVPTHPDDTNMKVTDAHLDEFATAIESFWMSLPTELLVDADADLELPRKFKSAHRKDMEELFARRPL
ncbi:hypothetical protein [Luteimonas fraxinea]|uniref:hypothetical protein n=1 Tax=Luteimonas fraxinea TaxID=2901869 RepID=UPI001E41E9FB|nr:hypothetical protein [Luteimonas fraxinea]MCD9126056.1 hypothetical protein [Luteimonas fraxinea]